jgi:uncharacterized BrkB/YihY/UPF0761 family membrane protein
VPDDLSIPMKLIQALLARIDDWQRQNQFAAPAYGIVKKFGDDGVNQFVVALGWYGFLAIYPLLLVVITIFGFIGAASLGHGIVSTLHQFPVIGAQFNPANPSADLHGSVFALTIGLLGMIYGAQGVTQTAQHAMARVWNMSELDLPGFLPRLVRSLISLFIIGGSFLANAAIASVVTGAGHSFPLRILVLLAMVVLNCALFFAAFRALTPHPVTSRSLFPGALVGSVGFTLLITIGSGLIQHQVRHSSATYGQFGIVIGLVGFLFLLAKVSLYGAELNTVLARHLWPRGIVSSNPSDADNRVLHDITHQQRRRKDQVIGVGFGEDAANHAAEDARRQARRTAEQNNM